MNATTGQFLLAVHRAARRMPHVEFRPWLFRELGSVLRFDSGLWLRIAISDDGPRMHDHHLDRQRPDRISSYLEQGLWREDPLMKAALTSVPGRAWVMSASDAVQPGPLRDHLELHEQRQVVCAFEYAPITRNFAGFLLFRRGRDDPFSEADRSLIEAVEPHLRDAWTYNWLREVGITRRRDFPADFAHAVFSLDSVLSASDEMFAATIQREWPEWQGPFVPAVWLDHVRRDPTEPWTGHSVTAYFEPLQNRLILLRLRSAHAVDRLSRRRRQVALLFAAGATQGEVAEALRLSPSTVNNYLVDVYRALGVADKAALALLVARLVPLRSVDAS